MARHPGRGGHAWRNATARVKATATHCGICGGPLNPALRWPHPGSTTVDHVVSLATMAQHGLSDAAQRSMALDPNNLRAAHLSCNSRRQAGGRRGRGQAGYTDGTW